MRHRELGTLELTAQVVDLTFEAQQLHRRNCAGIDHRTGDVQFFLQQLKAARHTVTVDDRRGQLLEFLVDPLLQCGAAQFEFEAARHEQLALLFRDDGIELHAQLRQNIVEFHPRGLGLQTRSLGLELADLQALLAMARRQQRVVDMQDGLILVDQIALLHQQFGENAALEILHHLNIGRRHHLALAPGDFVHLGDTGPQHHDHHEQAHHPQHDAAESWQLLQHGLG